MNNFTIFAWLLKNNLEFVEFSGFKIRNNDNNANRIPTTLIQPKVSCKIMIPVRIGITTDIFPDNEVTAKLKFLVQISIT